MKEGKVLAALQQIQEGVERLHLLVLAVRPEGVHLVAVALDHEDAQQVHETTILDALGVEEHLHLLVRDVGRAVDVDLLLADGQCLQGSVVGIARSLDSLASFPGAEGAGQLRQSEDPLAVILLQLLLAHAPEQADVVRLLRLRVAPLPELAEVAMLVERQFWQFAARLEPLDLVQDLLRLLVKRRVQADLAQPAIGATGDQPYGGPHPLYAGEDQPKHGKQQFLGPADLVPVVVQDGQVVVFAQLRGTVGPLQGVEADRHAVVLKGDVHQQRCSLLQRRGGDDGPSVGVALPVAGDEPGEAHLPRRQAGRLGHRLVVRLGAGLADELQVSLGLAVQIPFQDLVGDLHGRVPPRMLFSGGA